MTKGYLNTLVMEELNVNSDVLEVKKISVDKIIDEISIQDRSGNSQWLTRDLIIDIWLCNPLHKKSKEWYLVWLLNNTVVGYSYLQKTGDKEAVISFKVKEGKKLAPERLKGFLETTINQSFKLSNLEKILFDCGKNCSSGIPKAFIKHFQPHPVGWVHLNDGKYVLTRGQFDRTEEEFYKM